MLKLLKPSNWFAPDSLDDLQETVKEIRRQARELACESDRSLTNRSNDLMEKTRSPDSQSDASPRTAIMQALAIATDAVRRTHGFELYDVQLMGALAAASGKMIEMQTGEGKTVVTGLAAIARSFVSANCHVATTNDYLAERDFESLESTFALLDVSAGLLPTKMAKQESRKAYDCDITYGPGYQFGFDFLFDQITHRNFQTNRLGRSVLYELNGFDIEDELVQCRGFDSVIVDEADSVLVDEAMTPLILSFETEHQEDFEPYHAAGRIADQLEEDKHYTIDRKKLLTRLTDEGEEKILADRRSMKLNLARPWKVYIESALHAKFGLVKDEHYVVEDDAVKIVDPFTGRIFDDRSWQSGLHQAVEAKEGVPINPARVSKARITRQRFMGFYDTMCGLSGTVTAAARDLKQFYGAHVIPIPTHRPCRRIVHEPRFFKCWESKLEAIAGDVATRHQQGQPILIGTRTVRESKIVFEAIRTAGLAPLLLNGVQDQEEAEIVAMAGRIGQITIATNMAGRGTDIKLNDEARQLGGLHVIGTEPNTSVRIDRQLVGRAARQGDPGSAQFFISAEDDVIATHATRLANRIATNASSTGETKRSFAREVAELQATREKVQFHQRQEMVRQDNWMDTIRDSIFGEQVDA